MAHNAKPVTVVSYPDAASPCRSLLSPPLSPTPMGNLKNAAMQNPQQHSTPGTSTPPMFSSPETRQAVGTYTTHLILAATLNPYSVTEDMVGRCLPELAEVRKAAMAEGEAKGLQDLTQVVDTFIAETQARVIRLALDDDNDPTPLP